MKKTAIILMSYDGIVNNYCGVGTSVRDFVHSFYRTRDFFLKEGISLELHLISPALVKDSLGYSQKVKEESEEIVKQSNGSVNFVINGSDGMIPFGDINNWKVASISAATTALNIAQKYEESILFCFDTPFAHVPHYVNLQKKAFNIKNIKSVIVFESDVYIHEPKNPSFDRMGWEASALKSSQYDDSVIIADTGEFISNHLVKNYGLDRSKFVNLTEGLNPESKRFLPIKESEIKKCLVKYKIPLDKKLVFSVGRAVEYKGFDILIKAFSKIKEDAHLVFIASPYKTETSFVSELQTLLKENNIQHTAIFDCDFELPKHICQWSNTKIVAQLSRCEPFGLVPEEVRLWAQKVGPVILASNKDGFIEQIEDGKDGFLVELEDIGKITDKIDSILRLPDSEIEKIRQKGKEKFDKNFDFRINQFKCIAGVIGRLNEDTLDKFKKELSG